MPNITYYVRLFFRDYRYIGIMAILGVVNVYVFYQTYYMDTGVNKPPDYELYANEPKRGSTLVRYMDTTIYRLGLKPHRPRFLSHDHFRRLYRFSTTTTVKPKTTKLWEPPWAKKFPHMYYRPMHRPRTTTTTTTTTTVPPNVPTTDGQLCPNDTLNECNSTTDEFTTVEPDLPICPNNAPITYDCIAYTPSYMGTGDKPLLMQPTILSCIWFVCQSVFFFLPLIIGTIQYIWKATRRVTRVAAPEVPAVVAEEIPMVDLFPNVRRRESPQREVVMIYGHRLYMPPI